MFRTTLIAMCKAFPGGTSAMATALGFTPDALKNRIYQRRGQTVSLDDAVLMQEFSGTKLLANEIARRSGGVFLEVIPRGALDRVELLSEFNRLTTELGQLTQKYELAVRDGQIDKLEKNDLKQQAYKIHKQLERILAISFELYMAEDEDEE